MTNKFRNEPKAMPSVFPNEGIYLLTSANIEAITLDTNVFFQELWLYPAKAMTAGVLTANSAEVYVGKSGSVAAVTLDKLENQGSLATAYKTAHGFLEGASGVIASATPAAFNGNFTFINVTADSFQYRMLSVPTGPATGTITATRSQYLPDILAPTDLPVIGVSSGSPYKMVLPLGQKMGLSQIIIKGTTGDGVFYSFT